MRFASSSLEWTHSNDRLISRLPIQHRKNLSDAAKSNCAKGFSKVIHKAVFLEKTAFLFEPNRPKLRGFLQTWIISSRPGSFRSNVSIFTSSSARTTVENYCA